MKKIKVRLSFTQDVLGSAPSDPNIYEKYIASKATKVEDITEEVDTLPTEDKGEAALTVFNRDKDGNPIIWDYQIKGFFKSACGFLKRIKTEDGKKDSSILSSGLTAHKKEIDGLVFVKPRMIPIHVNGEVGLLQRILRTETPKGSRNVPVASECVPAGSWCEFTVTLLNDQDEPLLMEWLEYGMYNGLGQWRNAGYGSFTTDVIEIS